MRSVFSEGAKLFEEGKNKIRPLYMVTVAGDSRDKGLDD